MMKRLLYVLIFALWVTSFPGCSDSDHSPDPLRDLKDAADSLRDLIHYSRVEAADGVGDDFIIASEDLFIFESYITPAFNKVINFSKRIYSDNTYTDKDGSTTIGVSGSVYTLTMKTLTTLDSGQTTEFVRVVFSYDISTDRWLILAYRGGTLTSEIANEELWFKQEGDLEGNSYYVATSFYIEEEEDLEVDPPEYAPIHISNLIYEGTANVLTSLQMALERDDSCELDCSVTASTEIYPDGVVTAGYELWADFSIYNIDDNVPDYEIELP